MAQKTIRLHPFSGQSPTELDITCTVNRQARLLQIEFRMQGDLKAVAIPAPAGRPARRHRLWEQTCFECFMAAAASPAYREFNQSPSGDWNAYCFDDYRKGMREETAIPELIPDVRREPDLLALGCRIDLGCIGLEREALVMGVAAVVRSAEGQNTYWAASHAGPKPDFHRRQSFVVKTAPLEFAAGSDTC